MMTSDRMISTYFETGTLQDLPRDHFIDGAFVAADSGNRMESFDAGTGEAFSDFAAGTAADVDRAVTSAAKGFEVWRNTPPARRCAILNEAARLMRAEVDRIAAVKAGAANAKIATGFSDMANLFSV